MAISDAFTPKIPASSLLMIFALEKKYKLLQKYSHRCGVTMPAAPNLVMTFNDSIIDNDIHGSVDIIYDGEVSLLRSL